MSDRIFLRWGDQRNRVDDLVARWGDFEMVELHWQPPASFFRILRPFLLFLRTLRALRRHHPRQVLSHHTQPFCSLACVLYARFAKIPVVTDCHNGPFVDPIWQRFPLRQIHRYVFRRSTANIVHNEAMLEHVTEDLAIERRFIVLRDAIPDTAARVPRGEACERPTVLFICSWSPDEPMEQVVATARQMPEIDYWVTGRPRDEVLRQLGDLPSNLRLLGFVSDDNYDVLIRRVNVALVLSTRDRVLTHACHEAIGAECALVISDSPTARAYLRAGTHFVENDAASITRGVRSALQSHEELRAEMAELKLQLDAEWQQQSDAVRAILAGAAGQDG